MGFCIKVKWWYFAIAEFMTSHIDRNYYLVPLCRKRITGGAPTFFSRSLICLFFVLVGSFQIND